MSEHQANPADTARITADVAEGATGQGSSLPGGPVKRAPPDLQLTAPEDGMGSWLLSYVDLFTLLVVMFVVMLSFSSPVQQSLASAATAADRDRLLSRFQQQLTGLIQGGQLSMSSTAAGIALQLEEEILFDSATADLLTQGKQVLQQLIPALKQTGQAIAVEGHTDNRPIATPRFPSNWELSGARAAQVARYLIQQGIAPERVSATGYADTRPVADNGTAEGRARNRRVTLLVKPLDKTDAAVRH